MTDAPSVLIVEDDAHFRAGLVAMLKGLGLGCVPVASGHEALEVLADLSRELHLVITDMRLKAGTGWEVVEAARTHRGESLPVIMQSGEAQYSDVRSGARKYGIVLIDKADVPQRLLPAVREALRLCPDGAKE